MGSVSDAALGSGTTGAVKFLRGDRTWVRALYALTAASQISTNTFSSSTADNAVASLTLPSTLGLVAGDVIRFRASGSALNNSGGSVNYTFSFVLGSTVIFTSGAISYATGSQAHKWLMDFDVVLETTTAQRIGGQFVSSALTATNTGAITAANCFVTDASATENLAADAVFAAKIQMGTSHASASATGRTSSLRVSATV